MGEESRKDLMDGHQAKGLLLQTRTRIRGAKPAHRQFRRDAGPKLIGAAADLNNVRRMMPAGSQPGRLLPLIIILTTSGRSAGQPPGRRPLFDVVGRLVGVAVVVVQIQGAIGIIFSSVEHGSHQVFHNLPPSVSWDFGC